MPTTTRSSEPRARRQGAVAAGFATAVVLALAGCEATPPAAFFELSPETPANKAAQTRYFETRDADELLSASAAVLQDLGFHMEESVREMGFLRAAKERSARETGQELTRTLLFILSFGKAMIPVDLQQKIAATLVARPIDAGATRHEVRIMFYRVVWKGEGMFDRQNVQPGQQSMEMIRDPVIYQQFFAKLSKAVFLEPFTL